MREMLRKEIEATIAKYLRKANRLKSTQAKLERINELIELIREITAGSLAGTSSYPADTGQKDFTSAGYLEQYLELCRIHKLKFQMDATFFGVKNDIGILKRYPEQINQDMFDSMMQRLQVVLNIDADHLGAQELIQMLHTRYPQYVQSSDFPGLNLDIVRYQLPQFWIDITCNLQDVTGRDHLNAIYKQYQGAVQSHDYGGDHTPPDNASLCRMRFSLDHLKDFEVFHEELRVKPSYKIAVNNYVLDEQSFTDWFQCYKWFLKANNPQYCYGVSPFTFNVFGCHKLYIQDIAKQLAQCWFQYGTLDQDSGLFFINKKPIAEQIQTRLRHCGFCPALTQTKLILGMALIPAYINPECDNRWEYLWVQGKRTGVMPSGNDIAIAVLSTNSSQTEPSAFIEAGSTPYIHKALRYLQSNDPADLSEPAYRGLTTCMICGTPYKPHTMKCSKCKAEFWKYALNDLDQVLNRLRYVKEIKLQTWTMTAQKAKIESYPSVPDISEGPVSFEQLWNDPQIQAILSREQDAAEGQRAKKEKQETGVLGPRTSKLKPKSAGYLELYKRIKGLISKKYWERKAIEHAFLQPTRKASPSEPAREEPERADEMRRTLESPDELESPASVEHTQATPVSPSSTPDSAERAALINAVRSLRLKQKSNLSKRGVVRVIYHATMDKETCPLCNYLDGMVMDPDDPATEIFSPPLYPGCTCRREYVLKTEKPKNWPKVTFTFPPDELLIYLNRQDKES
jgi:hypothetical protein